jgi:uncharacterized membrane protein HdeD (DUF308 family)
MEETASNNQGRSLGLGFWITLVRGFLVIFLGLALILAPEKISQFLFNFIGIFWLMGGVVSLRRETHRHGSRLLLAAGFIGILAGLLVVTRNLSRNYIEEYLVIDLLGIVIVLTGILHTMVGFQVGRRAMSGRTEISILMGVIEIVLGGMVLLIRTGEDTLIYWLATIWALLGGAFLFLDAWRQYRKRKLGG